MSETQIVQRLWIVVVDAAARTHRGTYIALLGPLSSHAETNVERTALVRDHKYNEQFELDYFGANANGGYFHCQLFREFCYECVFVLSKVDFCFFNGSQVIIYIYEISIVFSAVGSLGWTKTPVVAQDGALISDGVQRMPRGD
mmetsp:Transcript_14320/g.22076  ORF Transcript_14320/g.22076 Transcript_14320/m.22076 type:complete len:143 (+) Transcript_14320:512-940(+)